MHSTADRNQLNLSAIKLPSRIMSVMKIMWQTGTTQVDNVTSIDREADKTGRLIWEAVRIRDSNNMN